MFVYSFKASKKKMRLGILVLIGLIAAILIVVLTGIGGGDTAAQGQAQETAAPTKIPTNEERVNYLKSFGWEVNPMPVSSADVTIPKTFDAVYEEYNVVQKSKGWIWKPIKGKLPRNTATRF